MGLRSLNPSEIHVTMPTTLPAIDSPTQHSDQALVAMIDALHTTIENLARARDLWFDCCFKTRAEHVDGELRSPAVVSLMWFEGLVSPLYFALTSALGVVGDGAKSVTRKEIVT